MSYKKKNLINISIVAIIFVIMAIYFLKVESIENVINVFKSANIFWLVCGILLIVIYWLLEALCLYIVEKKIYKEQKYIDSLKVSMIGQLFNCITPFSSGGQPMQAVSMKLEGKSISNSATILLIKFIVYQLTLVVFSIFIIIFEYGYFRDLVPGFIKLAFIGFLVNLAVIVVLIIIGAKKSIVKKFMRGMYKFLGKIKIIKNVDERIEKINASVDNFHENFKIIKKEKKMVLELALVTFIQLIAFFTVTFAVYKMLGGTENNIIRIVSAQAFLSMIMAFVPIPGAGIAAEGGFYLIFKTFFAPEKINIAILMWRMITFYLPIIVGGIFMALFRRKNKIKDILEEAEKTEIDIKGEN